LIWADALQKLFGPSEIIAPLEGQPLRWAITQFEDDELDPPSILELAAENSFEEYARNGDSSPESPDYDLAVESIRLHLEGFLAVEMRATRLVLDSSGLHPYDRLPFKNSPPAASKGGRLRWVTERPVRR